jgi:copper(I)-binding protein
MRIFLFAAIALLLIIGSSGELRAQTPPGKSITVADAWARATPKGSKTGVIYITLTNSGQDADRLLGGTTPVAEKVQFHSNENVNGVMKMRELTSIEIEPGKGRAHARRHARHADWSGAAAHRRSILSAHSRI